jgi:hypothetical protein
MPEETEVLTCRMCNRSFPEKETEGSGIHIFNFSIDMLPVEIFICDSCAVKGAVNFISGKIPGGGLIGKMKGMIWQK